MPRHRSSTPRGHRPPSRLPEPDRLLTGLAVAVVVAAVTGVVCVAVIASMSFDVYLDNGGTLGGLGAAGAAGPGTKQVSRWWDLIFVAPVATGVGAYALATRKRGGKRPDERRRST